MNLAENDNKVPWTVWTGIYIILLTFFIGLLLLGIVHLLDIDPRDPVVRFFTLLIPPCISTLAVFIAITRIYKLSFIDSMALRISKETLIKYLLGGISVFLLAIVSSMIIGIISFIVTGETMPNPYKEYSQIDMKVIALLAIFIAP